MQTVPKHTVAWFPPVVHEPAIGGVVFVLKDDWAVFCDADAKDKILAH